MEFVEQLKASVDIVGVVGEYVRLRKSGTNRYMGLCPFHTEKSPSFTVHVVHQFYKCFSCGAGGDVVKFVMEKEGISFYEALKSLAERHGIPMPQRSQYADEDTRLRGAILAMHELAQENFRANLHTPAGEAARAYIAKRGLTGQTAEHFGLGYSDRSGRALLRLFEQQHYPAAQMEQSGLVKKRQDGSLYDGFRNRLMFPIHNEAGKIIAFGGRALAAEDMPKYLNSPETPVYKKSHVLYNLHRAKETIRKEDRAILVEGYMDAIGVTAAILNGETRDMVPEFAQTVWGPFVSSTPVRTITFAGGHPSAYGLDTKANPPPQGIAGLDLTGSRELGNRFRQGLRVGNPLALLVLLQQHGLAIHRRIQKLLGELPGVQRHCVRGQGVRGRLVASRCGSAILGRRRKGLRFLGTGWRCRFLFWSGASRLRSRVPRWLFGHVRRRLGINGFQALASHPSSAERDFARILDLAPETGAEITGQIGLAQEQ